MIDLFCRRVMEVLGTRRFIETGVFQGQTMARVVQWFSEFYPNDFGTITGWQSDGTRGPNPWNEHNWYPILDPRAPGPFRVTSIELDHARWERAHGLLARPNVHILEGDSRVVLKDLIDQGEVTDADTPFFHLDAHWQTTPLLEELEQVKRLRRCIISIDDVVVPDQPHWGYDAPGGTPYSWDYIRHHFDGRDARVLYPVRSNEDNRGFMLIFLGFTDEELAGLKVGTGTGQLPMWWGP